MTIPFLDLFKKVTSRFREAAKQPAPAAAPAQRTAKPESERLHKTVLPNSVRAAQADHLRASAAAAAAQASPASGATKRGLPPAVALALQPKIERAISLQLSDILDQVPSGYMKSPETLDTSRRILLNASEIEKGMASGKPTVSLATLYEQMPEIFLHSLPSGETAHVALPYVKVMEQFTHAQVRTDQEVEQTVAQFDTPFLQVTIEDTERFGTTVQPLQTSAHPPVKVQPATAETLSTAEPEPAAREAAAVPVQAKKGIPLSSPPRPVIEKPPTTTAGPDAPARIPFHLPPNGMGGTASERVPASSGPSIPTGVTKAPAARIPFKISAPSDDLRPKLTLVPGVESEGDDAAISEETRDVAPSPENRAPAASVAPAATKPIPIQEVKDVSTSVGKTATAAKVPAVATKPTSVLEVKDVSPAVEKREADVVPAAAEDNKAKVSLSLQTIMQNVPAFQLHGGPESIPADVQITFPLSLIEPQLAVGRVAIAPQTFQAAMPQAYRELLVIDTAETPVLLPLQEVLKNLPSAALKMRDDQEEIEAGEGFETPFSVKAAEDAKRFGMPATPVAKPTESAPAEPEKAATVAEQKPKEPAAKEKGDGADRPEVIESTAVTGPAATPPQTKGSVIEVPIKPQAETEVKTSAENKATPPETKQEGQPPEEKAETAPEETPPETVDIKGRKEKNEAKDVVVRASALPGVAACSVTFADGLGLAGNLPSDTRVEGLCAMAPSLLQKIERHMVDTKLGPLRAMTLHGEKSPMTFFMQGSICLSVLHVGEDLASQTQQELAEMTKALSRTYSQPEAAHVHH